MIILKKYVAEEKGVKASDSEETVDGADCRAGGDSGMRDQYITMFSHFMGFRASSISNERPIYYNVLTVLTVVIL